MKESSVNKNTLHKTKKTTRVKKQEEYRQQYSKDHMKLPVEDANWALSQKPSVAKLWLECWLSDPYGSRMMPLNTELPYGTFKEAKKVIADAGLFLFKPNPSVRDGRETVCWQVQNLHGSRVKAYWQKLEADQPDLKAGEPDLKADQPDLKSGSPDSISSQTLTQQAFPDPSESSHKHFNNSSKEVLKCAESSTSKETGTVSAGCRIVSLEITGLGIPEEELGNETSPREIKGLEAHFEAAMSGIMPPQGVMEELRNSKYWTGYVAIAKQNGWGIELRESTMTPEARQIMKNLKDKKKPWLQ